MSERKAERRQRQVTMRDVAELAKVSQSTVSRVLNGADGRIPIGDKTRRRVLAAVEELGYQPNLHAGSLRGQKTRMIAIMIADIANPFYHPMVRAVQDIAATHRYDVMIANSDHMLEHEQHFVESVIRRPVDGVIMVPIHLDDHALDHLIERTGVALVALGQHVMHPDVDVVYGNDDQATEDVVTWLHTAKGHRRIGFIGIAGSVSAGARRHAAYVNGLTRAGLKRRIAYEELGDWSPESGYAAMQRILDVDEPPTAVFVCNDLMAIGAMEAVQQRGLHIPDDMALIGFDDIPAASWMRPRLSTVAQYPVDMGTWMAKALFERIHEEYSGPARRHEVPCRFVERDTT